METAPRYRGCCVNEVEAASGRTKQEHAHHQEGLWEAPSHVSSIARQP